MRGKPSSCDTHFCPKRLIPACAGKTETSWHTRESTSAHPRVCGENRIDFRAYFHVEGSSPRVRGKLPRFRRARGCGWLIPACAGKTCPSTHRKTGRPAHPRVCGENLGASSFLGASSGSSPRVRGKLSPSASKAVARWLIPACAGKTHHSLRKWLPDQAHPRVCGENDPGSTQPERLMGSSPRVRGKLTGFWVFPFSQGLIPACAGKTPPFLNSSSTHCGSSPRVRGKLGDVSKLDESSGLIPACAGKTRPQKSTPTAPPAHPRVCGENLLMGQC